MKPIDELTDDELILELAGNLRAEQTALEEEAGLDRLKTTRGLEQAQAQIRKNLLRVELRKREKAKP